MRDGGILGLFCLRWGGNERGSNWDELGKGSVGVKLGNEGKGGGEFELTRCTTSRTIQVLGARTGSRNLLDNRIPAQWSRLSMSASANQPTTMALGNQSQILKRDC